MTFQLVFEKSGDTIPCVAKHNDLVEYYIDFINRNNANGFSLSNELRVEQKIEDLNKKILKINNSIFTDIMTSFNLPSEKIGFLDQEFLNQTHIKYVKDQGVWLKVNDLKKSNFSHKLDFLFESLSDDITHERVSGILYKYNLLDDYRGINDTLHDIESAFDNLRFQGTFTDYIETENLFPDYYASNSICNVSVSYNHVGRSLYGKFKNWNKPVDNDDENTYNELLGFVTVKLSPPETIAYSVEYLEWCKQNDRNPSGDFLNLGNIFNLEDKLFDYRKVIYNNLQQNNKLILAR
tara:strand:+ start:536 stop:1417 length:882 start_codon:yes stop_codon:yes gene_type:complete